MFWAKPEIARVRIVRQFRRHLPSPGAAPSSLPPRERNTTFPLEGLGGWPNSFNIGDASGHNATEGVSCCVEFRFRNCQVPVTALRGKLNYFRVGRDSGPIRSMADRNTSAMSGVHTLGSSY
jgi:hypothetical protein